MNLCVVSPFPPELTGVGQYGWNIVQGLAQTGAFSAITVLAQTTVEPDHLAAPSGIIEVRRSWSRDDLLAGARLARQVRAAKPEVVWFNLGYTVFGASRPVNFLGLLTPYVTRRLGLPLVTTLHQIFEVTPPSSIGARNGHLTAFGAHTATRLLLQAGTVCVTLSRYQRVLQAHYGGGHVHHIPLGAYVSPEALPYPDPPREDILFFGSVAPFKGLPVLLEAFERLQRHRPQVTLTIAGGDHPRFPGYSASLQRATGAGPSGVRWLGARPESELRALFAQARVVALPYLATTGASSVLYRAATYGRAVVASDLVDLRAAAEEAQLAVDYVPPGDPAALAEALAALLADPARQAAQAQHNLRAMQTMTVEQTCARYLELFEQSRDRVRAGRA